MAGKRVAPRDVATEALGSLIDRAYQAQVAAAEHKRAYEQLRTKIRAQLTAPGAPAVAHGAVGQVRWAPTTTRRIDPAELAGVVDPEMFYQLTTVPLGPAEVLLAPGVFAQLVRETPVEPQLRVEVYVAPVAVPKKTAAGGR